MVKDMAFMADMSIVTDMAGMPAANMLQSEEPKLSDSMHRCREIHIKQLREYIKYCLSYTIIIQPNYTLHYVR